MISDRADTLIDSADLLVPDAAGFGRELLRRAYVAGLINPDVPAETVARKARSLGQALTLVIKNVDMLESVRSVLKVGTVSPFMMGDEHTFQTGIRREARAEIAERAAEIGYDLDEQLQHDWTEVIEATCDAVFGAETRSQRAAA